VGIAGRELMLPHNQSTHELRNGQRATGNGRGDTQSSNHELGPSSLLSTFPRVTKLANSIRESISSIVLDSRRDAGDKVIKLLAQRERSISVRAHRVFISLAHVISLRGGAFKQAPIIPRKSATRDSNTI
jgi:hypothetical protein